MPTPPPVSSPHALGVQPLRDHPVGSAGGTLAPDALAHPRIEDRRSAEPDALHLLHGKGSARPLADETALPLGEDSGHLCHRRSRGGREVDAQVDGDEVPLLAARRSWRCLNASERTVGADPKMLGMAAPHPTPTNYVTLDLLAWQEQGSLILSPKFQRRAVWKQIAKSYFVDTLLRGYPVPPLHIRLAAASGDAATREVVDGQQRLRALFDFIANKYRLSGQLEGSWAGKTYSELTSAEQEQLRLYNFHVFQYQNVDDRTILEVFARINTYSVALNRQELRNGKYFGSFKQAVYGLALAHLQFWRAHGIFTESSIARMQEAELVSELLVLQLDGLQDKKASLDDFYAHLDKEWPDESHPWKARDIEKPLQWLSRSEAQTRFERTIAVMESAVGDLLLPTAFHRVPLFYTAYAAVYHRMFGLPGFHPPSPRHELDKNSVLRLRAAVESLSELVTEAATTEDLRGSDRDFLAASARQTDNLAPRRRRLEVLWNQAELGA